MDGGPERKLGLPACKITTGVLLFPVDRDTHEFFCRRQSNVFDAASLF